MYESLHVLDFYDIRCSNLPEVIEILPASIEAVPGGQEQVFFNALTLPCLWPSQGSVDRPTDRGDTKRDRNIAEGKHIDGTAWCVVCPDGQRALEGR